MKMILSVMPTNISDDVSAALIENEYRVTKFASTAGLLTGGTTTLMVVADTAQIDQALDLIRTNVPPIHSEQDENPRVTIYVLKVKDFEKV